MISKKELISRTATELGITQKDCTSVIDMFIDGIVAAVGEGEDVSIGDLGKFVTVATKATEERTMVSGLTGKEVVIPAKPAGVKAGFKIGKKVKDAVSAK